MARAKRAAVVQQQQQTQPPTDLPIVICPGCNIAMRVLRAERIMFTQGLVDVSYECQSCGMVTKRTIKGT
jgi:RNase P subunit RPR2